VRKLNYELESRVERRTQELSVTNERLEETIEDLKNAQHHLIESEKMAALGVLVAGMAHEINTPLGTSITGISIIKNNTASLLASYNTNSISKRAMEDYLQGVTEVISLIENNLTRAASQISFYKRVSIDQEGESEVSFNLTSYLNDMVAALGNKLDPKRISFENNLPSPVMIESYPNIIYQVFSNLILNSIQHGFDSEMEGLISVDYQDKGDWIEIVYQDNGKGMDEQIRKHIFEPFYTTKRGQGGSGLGLSIVYSLLTGTCQGHISCESAPGEGARFIIDLPKQQAKASTAG
jgi:signal transduction histidine kinase